MIVTTTFAVAGFIAFVTSNYKDVDRLVTSSTSGASTSVLQRDIDYTDFLWGSAGLYQSAEGSIRQISSMPVQDLCFYRTGANSSGPVILTSGGSIIEIECGGSTEKVWLASSDRWGLLIDSLWSWDGVLGFHGTSIDASDNSGGYFYVFQGTSVSIDILNFLCVDCTESISAKEKGQKVDAENERLKVLLNGKD